jgi:hypothetical protein
MYKYDDQFLNFPKTHYQTNITIRQMEEIAEAHPKNYVGVIALEPANPPHESDKNEVACGTPTDRLIDPDNKTAFLIKVSDLVPCAPTSYCPAWKTIASARIKEGQEPMDMDQWMSRMNLEIKSWENKGNRLPTHVTMNNGRFHISDDQEDEFLRWYAVSLSLNKRMWFVEQLTSVFRYFVDLDFSQLVGIPERAMQATAMVVQRVVLRFFPGVNRDGNVSITKQSSSERGTLMDVKSEDALRAIVCTTNYKFITAKDGKPDMVKTGVHMLWPNVYLKREDALNIRESIIAELEKEFGKRVQPIADTANNGPRIEINISADALNKSRERR